MIRSSVPLCLGAQSKNVINKEIFGNNSLKINMDRETVHENKWLQKKRTLVFT